MKGFQKESLFYRWQSIKRLIKDTNMIFSGGEREWHRLRSKLRWWMRRSLFGYMKNHTPQPFVYPNKGHTITFPILPYMP